MRVLFVCLGNICRSPTAEAVCRVKAPNWETDSAGTSDWHIGSAPYAQMMEAAAVEGYEMQDLKARQFSAEDFLRFDLILGMDADNIERIERLRPVGNETEVRCLTDFVDGPEAVPDPYYSRDFEGALGLIEDCVEALIEAQVSR